MKRRAWLMTVCGAAVGGIPIAAQAMAIIEFMELKRTEQYKIVGPIMIAFLKAGYKNVPDNQFTLIDAMEKLAYAKGYTYQSVEEVAKEAALNLGMKRAW